MDSLRDVLLTPAGLLLCNSIPHLTAGLRGEPFPTPFARPRGKGLSRPILNFYWGAANLALGLAILLRTLSRHLFFPYGPIFLALGALVAGTYLSWHFGKAKAHRAGAAVTISGDQ